MISVLSILIHDSQVSVARNDRSSMNTHGLHFLFRIIKYFKKKTIHLVSRTEKLKINLLIKIYDFLTNIN